MSSSQRAALPAGAAALQGATTSYSGSSSRTAVRQQQQQTYTSNRQPSLAGRSSEGYDRRSDDYDSSFNGTYPGSEAHLVNNSSSSSHYNQYSPSGYPHAFAKMQQQQKHQQSSAGPSEPAPVAMRPLHVQTQQHNYANQYRNDALYRQQDSLNNYATPLSEHAHDREYSAYYGDDKAEPGAPAAGDAGTGRPTHLDEGRDDDELHARYAGSTGSRKHRNKEKQISPSFSKNAAGVAATANENSTGGAGVSSIIKGYGTPHQLAFLSIVLLQTLASAAMIAIVWVKIRNGTPSAFEGLSGFFSGDDSELALRRRSITVYFAIFLFGAIFEIITAIDALRLNNTIQLIGVCIFVVAMMVYAALLDGQVERAISIADGYNADLYPSVRPFIIAMPIIQGVAVILLAYFTYKLFRDFGWEVLHLIGADRKLKRIYTKYQIFVCLVKFDFFFFVGFSLQYMILVLKVQEAEFIITIVAFPLTVLALILAVIAVRREIRWLSYIIFIAEIAALAYFVFKFFRLFQNSQSYRYQTSRKTLAVFSACAIVMLIATFWVSILCYVNYGQGLKTAIPGYFGEHRASRRQRLARKNSQSAGGVLDEHATRMSID